MTGVPHAPHANEVDRADTTAKRALYVAVRAIVAAVSRLYWRLRVVGTGHIPAHGPFIVAPVHRSNVDTLVISVITRRRLRYMGKAELWKHRWSAWFLSALGGFPVHRGAADREALKRCIEVIEGGEPLVVFPEGTRQSGPVVQELFEGAAYVAARTGAPILPVGIAGTEGVMRKGSKMIRPGHVRIVVGPPILAPAAEGSRVPRRVIHETTAHLAKELQRLFDEAAG